jgi:CTP synthase
LIPYLKAAGELKSKPAQHSVKELREIGLFPNIILCRADRDIEQGILDKISLFSNVSKDNVFKSLDLDSIYKVPLEFFRQGLDSRICELLGIWSKTPDIKDLEQVVYNVENPTDTIKIGVVGKYTDLIESYKSLDEALRHGAIANQVKLDMVYIDAEDIEKGDFSQIKEVSAILVPGGFGERGTEGKIKAIQFARENNTPFFGICLGMQLAMIEYARHIAKIKNATSMEFKDKGDFVVHFMEGQSEDISKGGSMRLGAYDCSLLPESLAHKIYKKNNISERHRHRLEINNQYKQQLQDAGMVISGVNKELDLVEVIELPNHPFFIACQYHPEFKSRPNLPHPLFESFVSAAIKQYKEQ